MQCGFDTSARPRAGCPLHRQGGGALSLGPYSCFCSKSLYGINEGNISARSKLFLVTGTKHWSKGLLDESHSCNR
jgi:hypothetical protein